MITVVGLDGSPLSPAGRGERCAVGHPRGRRRAGTSPPCPRSLPPGSARPDRGARGTGAPRWTRSPRTTGTPWCSPPATPGSSASSARCASAGWLRRCCPRCPRSRWPSPGPGCPGTMPWWSARTAAIRARRSTCAGPTRKVAVLTGPGCGPGRDRRGTGRLGPPAPGRASTSAAPPNGSPSAPRPTRPARTWADPNVVLVLGLPCAPAQVDATPRSSPKMPINVTSSRTARRAAGGHTRDRVGGAGWPQCRSTPGPAAGGSGSCQAPGAGGAGARVRGTQGGWLAGGPGAGRGGRWPRRSSTAGTR